MLKCCFPLLESFWWLRECHRGGRRQRPLVLAGSHVGVKNAWEWRLMSSGDVERSGSPKFGPIRREVGKKVLKVFKYLWRCRDCERCARIRDFLNIGGLKLSGDGEWKRLRSSHGIVLLFLRCQHFLCWLGVFVKTRNVNTSCPTAHIQSIPNRNRKQHLNA